LKYVSLFSGIEAASVAFSELDFQPVAFCELDRFCDKVLKKHYPNVPNLGDITKVDWSEFADESIFLIIGGSPCQSFSIAGNRESLNGESRLMFEYIRAIREIKPKWFIWENVPGALSAKGLQGESGGAFKCFLRELSELGYGMSWRVLDAQFFGVAQRRRRVFVVGCSDGRVADTAKVLFEPESMCWDSKSSKEKRESITRRYKKGTRKSSTLKLRHTGTDNHGGGEGPMVTNDLSCTLSTHQDQVIFCCVNDTANMAIDENMYGTLLRRGETPSVITKCIQSNIINRQPQNGSNGTGVISELSYTLTTVEPHAVVSEYSRPRRLTPIECERLQGFPDDYTKLDDKTPDSRRYKALGNSFAVPVVKWIGERILLVERESSE